jgi:hypothetical protein
MAQFIKLEKDGSGVVQGTALVLPAGTTTSGAGGSSSLAVSAWSSSTTYSADQLVTYSGSIYKSLQNANTNRVPTAEVTWWLCVVSKGTNGTNGAAGTAGADGGDFHAHDYAPSGGDGNDGDLWLQTLTGEVFYKVAGTWVLKATLALVAYGGGANADIDIGTETVDSHVYDGTCAVVWQAVIYQASTGSMRTMFVNAHVVKAADGYGGYTRTVEYSEGPGPDDIGTGPAGGLFSVDYDVASTSLRLLATVATNNWSAKATKLSIVEF